MSRFLGSRVRRTLCAVTVVILLHGGSAGADAAAPQDGQDDGPIQQVIPPGQEEALATMLSPRRLPGEIPRAAAGCQ